MTAFDEQVSLRARDEANAEDRLVKDSKLDPLRECVESLPLEYREVIVMRELEEMSYKEISDAADLPILTVMSRLSRGRRSLLECMI